MLHRPGRTKGEENRGGEAMKGAQDRRQHGVLEKEPPTLCGSRQLKRYVRIVIGRGLDAQQEVFHRAGISVLGINGDFLAHAER